jgi:type II secretory pathway pseudopilin PulG
LIELLVVIALIGLIFLIAVPRISSTFKLSLNSTAREMASTIKETYNGAVMSGRVHRVVYDLKHGQYWAESGPADVLLDTEESLEKAKQHQRFASPDEKKAPPAFKLDTSITRKKQSLPRGVEFEDVLTEKGPEPITEGLAYTHVFPHGISERTVIHLKDSSNHEMSLIVSPILGTTRVEGHKVTLEEAYANP